MQNPISSEATKKQRENVDRTTKDAEETYMWKLKQKGMGPNFGNGRSERQERKRGSIQMACLKQIAAYSRRLLGASCDRSNTCISESGLSYLCRHPPNVLAPKILFKKILLI